MKRFLILIITMLGLARGAKAEDLVLPLPVNENNNIIDFAARNKGWKQIIQDPLNPGTTIQNPLTKKQYLLRKLADDVQRSAQTQDHADRTANRKAVTDTLWRINP